MKTILLFGAGRSSSTLIRYLLTQTEAFDWQLRIGDADENLAKKKLNDHPRGSCFRFDAKDQAQREKEIEAADIVISMLPASFHLQVAQDCVKLGCHLITPSYITPEMQALDKEARAKEVLILNEIGVDPGIDHLSAKKIIDEINREGGILDAFESYCGGLIAPESDTNPWHYKFTWSPRNVVLAGQGGAARFIREGQLKYVPWHQLFRRITPVPTGEHGTYEGYANRDSLVYREAYGLQQIPTLLRGTLRGEGFCESWNALVQLGCTDDSYAMDLSADHTWRDYLNSFLSFDPHLSVEEKLCRYFGITVESRIFTNIQWLGLFETEKTGLDKATPAQLLQKKLEEKWKLEPGDKDMLVMVHRFRYTLNGVVHEKISSMRYIGRDEVYTAMSDTVGLPVGICVKLILTGVVRERGSLLPLSPAIYEPVLEELAQHGISFSETETTL